VPAPTDPASGPTTIETEASPYKAETVH